MMEVTDANHIATLFSKIDEDGNGELSKNELAKFLLSTTGKTVNETVLTDIFLVCDADGSGEISPEELVGYINAIKEPTKLQRQRHILCNVLSSVLFWALMLFQIGISASVSVFARSRMGHDPKENFNWSAFIGFCFISGCASFLILIQQHHKANLALVERATEKIVLWAKSDLIPETTPDQIETDDTMTMEEDEELGVEVFPPEQKHPPPNRELCAENEGGGKCGSYYAHQLDMSEADLRTILDKASIFLPPDVFKKVFARIDTDRSGQISFREIQEYATSYQERGRLTTLQFELMVLGVCFRSFVFWLMSGYEIGSILFTINAFWFEGEVQRYIYGVGSFLFFLGGSLSFWAVYVKHSSFLGYVQYLNTTLQLLAASCKEAWMDDDEAYKKLFATIDTGGQDGAVDFVELYDALTSAGAVIPLEVVRSVLIEADESGDGELQLDEFVQYLQSTATMSDLSTEDRFWVIAKLSLKDAYFWNSFCQLLGGLLYTIAFYPDFLVSRVAASRLSVTASLCFGFSVMHCICDLIASIGHSYDAIEHSKVKFKEMVLLAAAKTPASSCACTA